MVDKWVGYLLASKKTLGISMKASLNPATSSVTPRE